MHFKDILRLAARAWHEIKPASDPEFNDCQITHRENLAAAAAAAVNSGSAFTPFDKAVLRLAKADAEVETAQILENPAPQAEVAPGAELAGHAENVQMAAAREEFKGVESDAFIADEAELKGPLPKDFPAHDLLHEAGINTYTQLSKVEDFTTIAGVGPATAEKITNRLAEDSLKIRRRRRTNAFRLNSTIASMWRELPIRK